MQDYCLPDQCTFYKIPSAMKVKIFLYKCFCLQMLFLSFIIRIILGMTTKEKTFAAHREKEKGNEAFVIGDYQEAIAYYSR